MSALIRDPSTHAAWSPTLNGPAIARETSWGFVDRLDALLDQLGDVADRAWIIAAVNDWARLEYEREEPITAEDLEVAQREAREEERAEVIREIEKLAESADDSISCSDCGEDYSQCRTCGGLVC